MPVIFIIILFIVCVFLNDRQGQILAQSDFPHLIDFDEADIEKPYYTFDGVDYEKLPTYLYNREYRTCYHEYTRCARLTLYSSPVCGYWVYQNRLLPFYSICELDLISCKDMVKLKRIDMFGTTYRERSAYLMGDGGKCDRLQRRIAEGFVPSLDMLEPPEDESKYEVVTSAKDFQHDKTKPSFIPNSEYDYENYPKVDPLLYVTR